MTRERGCIQYNGRYCSIKEKDLGVTIRADMKVLEMRGIPDSKGNQINGLIRRNITRS